MAMACTLAADADAVVSGRGRCVHARRRWPRFCHLLCASSTADSRLQQSIGQPSTVCLCSRCRGLQRSAALHPPASDSWASGVSGDFGLDARAACRTPKGRTQCRRQRGPPDSVCTGTGALCVWLWAVTAQTPAPQALTNRLESDHPSFPSVTPVSAGVAWSLRQLPPHLAPSLR